MTTGIMINSRKNRCRKQHERDQKSSTDKRKRDVDFIVAVIIVDVVVVDAYLVMLRNDGNYYFDVI